MSDSNLVWRLNMPISSNVAKASGMTAEQYAKLLLEQGYYQVSRKYGMLARLPDGKTGRQALFEASMEQYRGLPNEASWDAQQRRWVGHLPEASAADHYCRVYAPKHLQRTVSQSVMNAFRKLGGGTAR
jgi:hypothetical protein